MYDLVRTFLDPADVYFNVASQQIEVILDLVVAFVVAFDVNVPRQII